MFSILWSHVSQASMSISTSALSQHSAKPLSPRRIRMCGFVMTPETAAAWASRITGKELDPYRNIPTVWEIILKKVQPYRINFKDVGEVARRDYMVITQSAWFKGYKDMDPSLIPQFEEGDKEAIARQLLEEEGLWPCPLDKCTSSNVWGC